MECFLSVNFWEPLITSGKKTEIWSALDTCIFYLSLSGREGKKTNTSHVQNPEKDPCRLSGAVRPETIYNLQSTLQPSLNLTTENVWFWQSSSHAFFHRHLENVMLTGRHKSHSSLSTNTGVNIRSTLQTITCLLHSYADSTVYHVLPIDLFAFPLFLQEQIYF